MPFYDASRGSVHGNEWNLDINNDPKMSRKRKVEADGRLFQDRWEGEYLFVLQGERPVRLLCYEAMSVVKEYNLRRHFDTKHGAKYAKASLQEKQQIAKELKGKLRSQQSLFIKSTAKNEAVVKASFIVAEEIALASKSFSEGAFLKQCMLKVCEQVCPDQLQTFKNFSFFKKHHRRPSEGTSRKSYNTAGRGDTQLHSFFISC